jgi:hypothetical protein
MCPSVYNLIQFMVMRQVGVTRATAKSCSEEKLKLDDPKLNQNFTDK